MRAVRIRSPELEHDAARTPSVGFEPGLANGCVRCLEHGVPNPLIRWHYHDEYELHLIVASRGRVFVGDYIGGFEPGHLVLTGPRLPHNWISADVPNGGYPLRDLVLQFSDGPLRNAARSIGELSEILSLLDRAKHGIEFYGKSDRVEAGYHRIKGSRGSARFVEFIDLLSELSQWADYRLLSTVRIQGAQSEHSLAKLSKIVDYITEHCTSDLTMLDICKQAGMEPSQFSRYFRHSTGNTFTEFLNRLRLNKACELLMETDNPISSICYASGFNNLANFNRRFLSIKGMTPRQFRAEAERRFGAAADRIPADSRVDQIA